MNNTQNLNPLPWLERLGSSLYKFQGNPNDHHQKMLLDALKEFQEVVTNGLSIPRTIPPPLRNARTFTEWYRRQLDEGLAMFQINPSDDRLEYMRQHLKGYRDAVAMGRVKL